MPACSRHTSESPNERRRASATRRAMLWLGSWLGLAASLGAGLAPTGAKKKKKKKKKKPPRTAFLLQAAEMTGEKEVLPITGDLSASGSATFTVKTNGTICCDFTFNTTTPSSVVVLTHIHSGGATTNGPVVVDFGGELERCVPISKALTDQLRANPAGFYANIHTNTFPDGAVRDQLSLVP
jgi:hypothetical protein